MYANLSSAGSSIRGSQCGDHSPFLADGSPWLVLWPCMTVLDVRRLTRSTRARLPGAVLRSTRSMVSVWGLLTAGLRMHPSLLIVGAQRCGTTTLFRLLSDHPALIRPTMSKGVGYFDVNYGRGDRWYRSHFPIARLATVRHHGVMPLAFESSGYYCYHPLAGQRLGADLPEVKLVMMVRDPVERAYSAHKHETARGFETEPFERALELEPERLHGEVERMLDDPSYRSFHHRHHSYVARGQYAEQLARLGQSVGSENVYVVDADHFFADPICGFGALTDWLGIARHEPRHVERWNARPSAPMAPGTRERLVDHFASHDEDLARLMGRAPSWGEGRR